MLQYSHLIASPIIFVEHTCFCFMHVEETCCWASCKQYTWRGSPAHEKWKVRWELAWEAIDCLVVSKYI